MKIITGTQYLLGRDDGQSTLAQTFDDLEGAQEGIEATRKHQKDLGYKPENFVVFIETFLSVYDDDGKFRSRTITRMRV